MRTRAILTSILLALCNSASPSAAWTVNGSQFRSGAGTVEQIDVVTDNVGGSYVCWADRRSQDYDIYMSRVDGNGSLVAGWTVNGTVICNATGDQKSPRLLPDGSGGVFVSWQDARSGAFDIYATHIMSSGTVASPWPANGLAICTAAASQTGPQLTFASDGNLILSWLDYRTTGAPAYYAQKISTSGASIWAANGVTASH